MFCLSPETSNLFLTREYLIITRSVQSDRRYCPYNNEGVDEIIPPLFLAYLCYCELLWQHFQPVLLKLQLYQFQLGSNIPSHSCTPRSRTEILWGRGAHLHTSPYGNTITYLCVYYSKINAPFSQNFSRERTRKYLPFCSGIKLTTSISATERKNFILKTQCFAR
jgi:hypothetical protein